MPKTTGLHLLGQANQQLFYLAMLQCSIVNSNIILKCPFTQLKVHISLITMLDITQLKQHKNVTYRMSCGLTDLFSPKILQVRLEHIKNFVVIVVAAFSTA